MDTGEAVDPQPPGEPHWTDAGTLLLAIAPADWPPPSRPLRLDGIMFLPKRELHATIVGRALGAELQAAMRDPALRASVERIRARLDWRWHRGRAWLRLEKDVDGRRIGSIIESIALPAMAEFHAQLGKCLGRKLEPPPPHVTLYTCGDPEGIGVPDPHTLRRLLVRVVHAAEVSAAVR